MQNKSNEEAGERDGSVPFTQFLRPYGLKQEVEAPVTQEYKEKADRILAHGWTFTCEVLTTGQVALYVTDGANERDVCIKICSNGPPVHEALDRMIDEGIEKMEKEKVNG